MALSSSYLMSSFLICYEGAQAEVRMRWLRAVSQNGRVAACVEGFTARSAGQGATGKANSPRHFCQLKNWLSDSVAVPHGTTSAESSQLGGPIHIQQSPTGSHDMSIGWHSGRRAVLLAGTPLRSVKRSAASQESECEQLPEVRKGPEGLRHCCFIKQAQLEVGRKPSGRMRSHDFGPAK